MIERTKDLRHVPRAGHALRRVAPLVVVAALVVSCGGSVNSDNAQASDEAVSQADPTSIPATAISEPTPTTNPAPTATPVPAATATPAPAATATPIPTPPPTATAVPAPEITLSADLFVFDRTEPSQVNSEWTGHYYVFQGDTDEQRTVYVEERPYFGLNTTDRETAPFDEFAEQFYDLQQIDSSKHNLTISELLVRPWGYRIDLEHNLSSSDGPRFRFSHLLIEESRSSFRMGGPPDWEVGNTFVDWVDQYFATSPPPASTN